MAQTVPERSTASGLRGWVAAGVTLAVAGATFSGSASALVEIGHRAGMAQPWVLPVGLDGLAIVAATAIHGRRRADWWPWAVLLAADGVSAALQVAAAPPGWANRVAHAVPPLAALLAFELFLRATDATSNVRAAQPDDLEGTAPIVEGGERKRDQPEPVPLPPVERVPRSEPIVPEGYDSPEVSQPTVEPERATLADARRIDAARHLSGRELERAILAAGLGVTRRRATAWAKELAAPAAPPDGAPARHLEAVAR